MSALITTTTITLFLFDSRDWSWKNTVCSPHDTMCLLIVNLTNYLGISIISLVLLQAVAKAST